MKKAMFRILAAVLVLMLLPATGFALPRTLDKSRIHRLDDYKAELNIGDMAFQGKFTNAELTDEKLDEMIKKTLAEMGLDEADFDLLNDLVNTMNEHDSISPEQMQKIFDRWFDMIGAVPYAGQAATLVQIIIQLNQGDMSGPNQSIDEEAASQVAEGFGDALDSSGISGKLLGNGIGIFKALVAVIEGVMDSNVGEKAVDRALGLEAYRLVNDFYGKLNREVDKHYKENKANYMVKFDRAEDRKPFTLFGTENTERWTLDMTLFQTESSSTLDIDGKYEGQYKIKITYDLSGFQKGLNQVILLPEWRETYAKPGWESAWGTLNAAVTNTGTCDVERTLSGYAAAYLYGRNGSPSISPAQELDEKDVNIYGIALQATATHDSTLDIECSITADEEAFKNTMTKWTVTYPDNVFNAPSPVMELTIPWEQSIWRRAVNADSGWKIALTPQYKK